MYKYILRFSLLPTVDFDKRCNDLLEFIDKALVDDVMFFIAPEEVSLGHITIEEAKPWVDTIKKMKSILTERGITTSLNPWVTLNHYDGGRPLKDGQDFTTIVGEDGVVAKSCVCPLDKKWRKYFVDLWAFYVREIQPDTIWIEDDMRLSWHEPVKGMGCFCSEHMKLYNEYLGGTNYDRETFIEKCMTDENCRRAYQQVNGKILEEVFTEIVEGMPEQKTFGLMTSGLGGNFIEGRKYDKLYNILGKNGGKPFNRVHLGGAYRQVAMQTYAWRCNRGAAWMRSCAPDSANFVTEIEDYPHSLYCKSAHFMRYQLLTSVAFNMCGATFSIFDFHGNGVVNGEKYAKVMREVKPYLSKINDFGLSPTMGKGVYVLYNEDSPVTMHPNRLGVSALSPDDGWWYGYLEQLGIACVYGTQIDVKGRVVALGGQVARNYTESQLRDLFKYNFVLLNAESLSVLCDMGLGDLAGVKSFEWWEERTGKYTMEEIATDEKVMGVEKLRATAQFFCGDYINVEYDEKADKTVYTNVLDYHEKVVGSGLTRVGNALIFPFMGHTPDFEMPIALLCYLRAHAMKKALIENPVSTDQLFFIAEENVCPYVFEKDGKTYIFCVNFSDDSFRRIHIDTDGKFFTLMGFTPSSERVHRIASWCEDGKYDIQIELEAQSSCLLVCEETD